MASSTKALHEALRNEYLQKVIKLFTEQGEEVLRTGSQEIAFPCVDSEGNDEFIVITVKVPTGTRDGEIYDGYAMADEYALKCKKQAKAKAEKAEKSAKRKAQKKGG